MEEGQPLAWFALSDYLGLGGSHGVHQSAEQEPWIGLLAGGLAIFVAILSGITTFLNPNDKETAFLTAAHAYDKINNDARFFHSIVLLAR
jgi:hypothetical protein